MKEPSTLLEDSITTLIRLRKAFHGMSEVQEYINKVLDKLYYIKF